MARQWTCQRVLGGVKCSTANPLVKRNCVTCGKPRPATKQPKHMAALDLSYEDYIAINGGEHCGICGAGRAPSGKRLCRDHDHRSGIARGLLCIRCNRALPVWVTVAWLHAAIFYLQRADERDEDQSGVKAVTSLAGRRRAA